MKNILLALALALIPASASAVTINPGETYIFAFDSLPNPTSITSEPGAWVNIPLLGFQAPDDQANLTAYENSLADVPFFDANFGGGGGQNLALYGNANQLAGTAWADGQGVFTVTAISGSFDIDVANILAGFFDVNGIGMVTSDFVTTVPLPAALPLFASGLAGLGWLARRRKRMAAVA